MKFDNDSLIKIYEKTKSLKETSDILNVTYQAVYSRLKKIKKFRKDWCNKKNEFIEKDSFFILYTHKNEEIFIDKDDFEKVKNHKWCISKTGYAVANVNKKTIKLHRFILNLENPKIIIDHINRNKLDNRKNNLRICSVWENSVNCSDTKGRELPLGISKTQNGKKYRVRIMLHRKEINLGRFENLEDAINERKNAEKIYFNGIRYR